MHGLPLARHGGPAYYCVSNRAESAQPMTGVAGSSSYSGRGGLASAAAQPEAGSA